MLNFFLLSFSWRIVWLGKEKFTLADLTKAV